MTTEKFALQEKIGALNFEHKLYALCGGFYFDEIKNSYKARIRELENEALELANSIGVKLVYTDVNMDNGVTYPLASIK